MKRHWGTDELVEHWLNSNIGTKSDIGSLSKHLCAKLLWVGGTLDYNMHSTRTGVPLP